MFNEVEYLKRLKSMSLTELRAEAGMLTEQWFLLKEEMDTKREEIIKQIGNNKELEKIQKELKDIVNRNNDYANMMILIEQQITKRYQK